MVVWGRFSLPSALAGPVEHWDSHNSCHVTRSVPGGTVCGARLFSRKLCLGGEEPGCRVGAVPGLKQVILHHHQKLLWKARPFQERAQATGAGVEIPWCPGGGVLLSRPLGLGSLCPARPALSHVAPPTSSTSSPFSSSLIFPISQTQKGVQGLASPLEEGWAINKQRALWVPGGDTACVHLP